MVQASHPGRVGSFSSVQVGHSQPSRGFTRCVFPAAAGLAVLSGNLVDFVPTFKTKGFSLSGMMASTAAPASSLSSDFVSPPPTPALSVSACSGLSSASSYSYSHSDSSPSSSSEFSC